MIDAFADYESRQCRVQLLTAAGYLSGKIKGGNKDVMMFDLEPKPGAYVRKTKLVNVVVAQIITFEELT